MRPNLGSLAEELYSQLAPFQTFSLGGREVTDEEMGWALLIYWGLIIKLWQPVNDLARDSAAGPGWSALLDPDRIPDEGLPWLSQLVGVSLLSGMTPAEQRTRIKSTDGMRRGTPAAVAAAAQRHLTGAKNVIINERLANNANVIGVVTYTAETPDPEQTRLDIEEQLPWWVKLQQTVAPAWNYDALRTAFDDYAAIRTHYNATGYLGIRQNNPPA